MFALPARADHSPRLLRLPDMGVCPRRAAACERRHPVQTVHDRRHERGQLWRVRADGRHGGVFASAEWSRQRHAAAATGQPGGISGRLAADRRVRRSRPGPALHRHPGGGRILPPERCRGRHAEPDRVHRGPVRARWRWPIARAGCSRTGRPGTTAIARTTSQNSPTCSTRSSPSCAWPRGSPASTSAWWPTPRRRRQCRCCRRRRLRESVEQAFALSRASQDAAQRSSLLKGITEALDGPAAEGGWAAALRARAMSDLVTSTRTDQAYAALERADAQGRRRARAPRRRHRRGGTDPRACSRRTTSWDGSGRRKPRRCWRRWICAWMRRGGSG